jgi:hypothetical protein
MSWLGGELMQPSAAPQRDINKELTRDLQAQINIAPALFAARSSQAFGDPAYTRLAMQTYRQALYGSENNPGMLDIYKDVAPKLSDLMTGIQLANATKSRQAALTDVGNMAPQVRSTLEAFNPETVQLLKGLTSAANADLAAGSALTPEESTNLSRSARSAWAARGLGSAPSSALQEAMGLNLAGNQLRQQRLANVASAAGANQSFYGDPFNRVLSLPVVNSGTGDLLSLMGLGRGEQAQNSMINPEDQYMQNYQNQNYLGRLTEYGAWNQWKQNMAQGIGNSAGTAMMAI